ncbi:unnamed protein product, partial [Lampetra planeri]
VTCAHPMTPPGECCPVCTGICWHQGKQYQSGSTFSSPSDPCSSCSCLVSLAILIKLQTFTPSSNPCQRCTCIRGTVMPSGEQHLRCYRKQCPSLVDCPKSNILFSGPDSCCPFCAQPLSNCTATLIGNEVLATDDPCFTCQCKDLTWTCLHRGCQPLTCPPDEQFTPADSCCPVCPDSGVLCLYQGTVYQSNEQWDVDECTSCTCVSGDVHCHSERCPPLACATDEMPAVVPGLCCPHCLPRPATCIAFGDPHYRTFDGRMLHFQGACTYVLAQDCEGGDFSVHATNDDRGRKGVSWTKEVTVFLGDMTVQLLQDWIVKVCVHLCTSLTVLHICSIKKRLSLSLQVDDEVVTLPFLREPYIYVERQTNTILLNTNIGLKVTNGSHSLASCRPGADVDPCKDAGYQAKKGANARCKVLKSAVFKPCHRVVPPEPWYGACVYDLCACGANTDDCLCDTLEAYASQCREAGVVLQWRSPSLC